MFAHEDLLAAFDDVFSGRNDTPETREDLETLAAALKPASTWHALDTLQEAREACGGAGFLAENRLVGPARRPRRLRDVRGRQQRAAPARRQAPAHRLRASSSSTSTPQALARIVAERAADAARTARGLRQLGQTVADFGSTRAARPVSCARRPRSASCSPDRVETMVAEIAQRACARLRSCRPATAAALFNAHQHELIEAARAHAELVQWEAFTAASTRRRTRARGRSSPGCATCSASRLIEQHLAWYLINGRLSASARAPCVVHRPAAGPPAPARAGPGRRFRVRAGAPARARSRRAPSRPGRTRPAPTTAAHARRATPRSRRSTKKR